MSEKVVQEEKKESSGLGEIEHLRCDCGRCFICVYCGGNATRRMYRYVTKKHTNLSCEKVEQSGG